MCLSSHIAQGETERLAGKKGSANLLGRLFPGNLGYCSNSTDQSINRGGRCVTISRRFEKTTHHRVTDNEKFTVQNYHISSGF
jgi:hypothetical protein